MLRMQPRCEERCYSARQKPLIKNNKNQARNNLGSSWKRWGIDGYMIWLYHMHSSVSGWSSPVRRLIKKMNVRREEGGKATVPRELWLRLSACERVT